jgi:T4 RNase H, C terminal/5'-3' exonuclease, N-terminal resolvase-like domain
MIITDLSQIINASIYMGDANECAKHPSQSSKDMIKHSIINSIRQNYVTHKDSYGAMVLACDSGSWRYDVFPPYKHSRKESRKNDTSGINWEFINEVKSELIHDLGTYFPFPVVSVPKAEGDDIIGVLAKHTNDNGSMVEDIFGNSEKEPILIISSDKDNYQLHMLGKHVKQWSPMDKKLVKSGTTARESLMEKIVKGDSGDGVPSIKSHDTIFIEKVRQKPISAKYLQQFFDSKNPIDVCLTESERINFVRNEMLVSYDKIPQHIQDSIFSCYNTQLNKPHSKMELMNYFVRNKFSNLLGNITDFYK